MCVMRCINTLHGQSMWTANGKHLIPKWWAIMPGSQTLFQFIPKVLEVLALCRPVKFFHTNLVKRFLYGPRFVHSGIVMLKQERPSPNCCHKVGSTESSTISL